MLMVLNVGILLEIYEMFYLLRKKSRPTKKRPTNHEQTSNSISGSKISIFTSTERKTMNLEEVAPPDGMEDVNTC